MKSKLFLLSALMLVLAVGVVSAGLTFSDDIVCPESVEHDVGSFECTFDLINDGDEIDLDWDDSTILLDGELPKGGSLSFDVSSIADGNIEEVTELVTATIEFDSHQIGDIKVIFDTKNGDPSEEKIIKIEEDKSLSVSDSEILEGETSTTITIENTGNVDLANIQLTQSGDFIVEFGTFSGSLIAGQVSDEITVTITTSLDELDVGENEVEITATADEETYASGTLSTTAPFCGDCQDIGDLNIEIDDVFVKEGFGDDDVYWYPFDEIEIDLFIESDEYDIEDIEIEWELYTESGDKIDDGTENGFDLDVGEDKDITISFKLDNKLSKLEEEDKLIFYVKAEGRIDDDEAGLDNDEDTCVWDSEEIPLITDDDFVILDDIEFPEVVQCGAEVQVIADVWNIGNDDQDDVYVIIYNEELGINEKVEIERIKAFDSEKLDTMIELPTNAEEKSYYLTLWVYDDDNDLYETSDEGDDSEFVVPFKIEGNCMVGPTVLVTANLESGGKAGQELVVKATITNIGNKLSTYDLNVVEYDEWASSVELDQSKVILGEGESKDVLLTFDVREDVSGDKLFDLELLSGEEVVLTQVVSVTIESPGFKFPGITGNVISKDNWYLWGIGALNIFLVIIIIVVAVRAIKK